MIEDVFLMYPFTKAGFKHGDDGKDLRLNPAVLHFIRQRYHIPNFNSALRGLNSWEYGMQIYKNYGDGSEV